MTFRHQAEGIAPIEVLVLIPLFSAIGAITENGPCTHTLSLKINIRRSHMNDRIRLLSPKGWEKSISRQIVCNFDSSKVKVLSVFLVSQFWSFE